MTAPFDGDLADEALRLLRGEPAKLTDAHLAQCDVIHGDLGKLARTRRTGTEEPIPDVCRKAPATLADLMATWRHRLRPLFLRDAYRLDTLEARLRELEGRVTEAETKGLEYHGVYRPGGYRRGAAVTHQNSLWIALRATSSAPGEGADTGWQMALRRPKDGRDGRDVTR